MSKKEELLRLIREGYTAPEITEKLGYKTDAMVYTVAKENGLTVTSPKEKRDCIIKELAQEGNSIKQIEQILEISEATVRSSLKRTGTPVPVSVIKYDERVCEICGKTYEATRLNQKYCCIQCARKAERRNRTNKKDDSNVAEMLRGKQPEWEYVDGYTGSNGFFNLRHKPCGNVYYQSVSTARKGGHLACECCDEIERKKQQEERIEAERKQKEEQKRIRRIWREFNKQRKTEQIQAKVCPECGGLFLSKHDKCDECRTAERKRYANRCKELKKRGSHTEQSKEISAYSVYVKEGGRCWLCGGQCDINADPNSDYYPSVDHILPQSLGGKDTWDNVHCAHRICNTRRGNRVMFDEPLTAISLRVE